MGPLIVDAREKANIRDRSDLAESLRGLSGSIPVRVLRLEFGDVTFQGNGPDGECSVGIERKRLSDLLNSMLDRRLAGHQLRGLGNAYDFRYLIAEGVWRPGPHGEIEELVGRNWVPFYSREPGRPAVAYRQLQNFLTTLEFMACRPGPGTGTGPDPGPGPGPGPGLVIRRTSNLHETAVQVIALWHWFNDKEWREHRSHEALYCGPVPNKGHGAGWAQGHAHNEDFGPGRAGAIGTPTDANHPSTLWRAAAQFPGLDARAKDVAQHWKTLWDMVLAGLDPQLKEKVEQWYEENPKAAQKAWEAIPGIGKKTAEACVRAVWEEGA